MNTNCFVTGVGRTNVDLLFSGMPRVPQEGEELFSDGFSLQLGGGYPGTLVNLGRLGVRSFVQTYLGEDMFSRFAREQFEKNGVTVFNLHDGGPEIPVNITSAVITPKDRAFISYTGAKPVTDTERQKVLEASRGAGIMMMDADYTEVCRELKKNGTRIVFDTGWDDNMSEAGWKDFLTLADYYTPNAKEAMRLTGQESPEKALYRLAKYFETPVVKLDRNGCILLINGKMIQVHVIPGITCVDSTGAGDAFLAGFVYGLVQGAPIEVCALYGNITGAECVTGVGCLTNHVTESELLARAEKYGYLIETRS